MEVTAESFLHALVGCSLIQDAGNEKYTLHDLVHDFALYMKEKEYVSTDQLNSGLVSHRARYVSSIGGGCSSETLKGQEKLRGLMCHKVDCLSTFNFAAFRWLRVLDLREGDFLELPKSIGDLMLLKYINLSGARIFELPESIIGLRELQTLILRSSMVKRLPNKISALGMKFPSWISSSTYSCLRVINIWDCDFLENLPNLGFLPNLVDLFMFSVGMIKVFDTTCDHVGGKVAFPKLETLRLWFMESLEEWKFDSKVENMPCLKELDMKYCKNLRVIPFFSTLKKLTIEYIHEWEGWPMAKERDMPCLKEMRISSSEKLKLLPSCPKLEKLFIDSCNELVELPSLSFGLVKATIGLNRLRLRKLPQLQSLPSTFLDSLGGLEELHIMDCPRLLMSIIDVLIQHPLPNLESLQLASWASDDLIWLSWQDKKCELVINSVEMSDKWAGLMVHLNSKVRKLDVKVLHGVDSLPERIQQLHQLKYLKVRESPHLTRLPHWLNKLSQLEWLELDNLRELVEVPAVAFKGLKRLETLKILSCPKLSSLPDELSSLPRLQYVDIFDCSLLAEWWRTQGQHKIPSLHCRTF
ncbi:putative disease resistance protein [Nymphaea thermarum]|nr:putative disease resistance protein [Nymphaea thermarum]